MLKVIDLEGEIWKDIKGYEGNYQISNKGRVKSFKYGKEKILKPRCSHGYNLVLLSIRLDVIKNFSVHRLVAEAFIPNPENKPTVNHIDGNKLNNTVENLEWMTVLENTRHAIYNGLFDNSGDKNHFFKGKIQGFDKEGNIVIEFCGQKSMKDNGYVHGNVYACINGKRKTHKGLTFKRV